MKYLRGVLHIIIIVVLTVVTQVGGIFYLIALALKPFLLKKIKVKKSKILFTTSFLIIYLFGSIFLVPITAKQFGRVPLPIFSNEKIKPLNILTFILNRHYVRPSLKESLETIADKMDIKYPNTVISYLDANFPFYNGFPLLPHLSHNDGKKIDIAFLYNDTSGKELNRKAPSFMGYGVFEEPKIGEYSAPENCESKGYWQYSFLGKIVPQWHKDKIIFDQKRTKSLIQYMLQEKTTGKIFIEPHLK